MNLISKSIKKIDRVKTIAIFSAAVITGGFYESAGAVTVNLSADNVPVNTTVFNKFNAAGEEIKIGSFQAQIKLMPFEQTIEGLGNALIRTSLNTPSMGETMVSDIGGGQFRIDSSFNLSLELSVDGGQMWIPGDTAVTVTLQEGAGEGKNPGVVVSEPEVPPTCGIQSTICGYWAQFHPKFTLPTNQVIELGNVYHTNFTHPEKTRCGNHLCERFDSSIEPVPEPLTILGSGLALGFGALFKKEYSRKRKKQKVS